MPWNGSGTFTRIFSWVADATAGIDILASRMDTDTDDIASSGFDNCLTRDGQGQPTANLPMAGFKHTNLGAGSASGDSCTFGQMQTTMQAGQLNWVAAGGTADAITATYSPALTALSDGQLCRFRATAANITTTPTFAPNGLTAHTITKWGGLALTPGDIPGDLAEVVLSYNLANTRWELLSVPAVPVGGSVPYHGGTVPAGFVLPQGQNLSATTYPAANAVLGTTYGNPGGGNFTMPDARGRNLAGLDAGGSGRITVAGGNFDGTTLGNAGGQQNKAIAQANLPNVSFTNSGITVSSSASTTSVSTNNAAGSGNSAIFDTAATSTGSQNLPVPTITSTVTAQGSAASGGSGTALPTLGPTLLCNIMMRIA
jgi:microcystin-dependent protein